MKIKIYFIKKKEDWESEMKEEDWLKYDWRKSKSKNIIEELNRSTGQSIKTDVR